MAKKLHFRSVVALVIGSQIGSGIFLLPTSLAPLGPISLLGWLISGIGALLLALVFSQLSMHISEGGGPHVYIEKAFGRKAAFFTAWSYWLISWASSIAVIVAAIGYLSPLIGISGPLITLLMEMVIITTITLINIRSASLAGSFEIFLTILKCLPLLVIPSVGLFFLDPKYFIYTPIEGSSFTGSLSTASLLTFWGFIGVETATTAAGIIENPTKTIPRAVLLGTSIVALIYFFNSFTIMGIVPPDLLKTSPAPYAEASRILFGGVWGKAVALMAFISCVGTLNAWVLTSGQIAKEAGKERLFPSFFAKTNSSQTPYISLLIALVCTQILLFLTLTPNLLDQLNRIIDLSVSLFLFIYLGCSCAFLKMLAQKTLSPKRPKLYMTITVCASLFCLWILAFSSWKTILLCSAFIFSGLPVYFWQSRKTARQDPSFFL